MSPAHAMQGDGPRPETFEYHPPVTLGELIATSDNNFDLLGAMAMARCWPEGMPARELEPWQRIGPDILWMVYRQDYNVAAKIRMETVNHVISLRWVARKRLSRIQVDKAVTDAMQRLVTRECMPAEISALSVAMRVQTFLDLRTEALAFMVNCMVVAEYGVRRALGIGPESEIP